MTRILNFELKFFSNFEELLIIAYNKLFMITIFDGFHPLFKGELKLF